MVREVLGHEPGVLDADAEPEATHRGWLGVLGDLLDDQACPRVGAGVGVAEGLDVVPVSAAPRDVSQIESVVDAEVQERCEVLLVDGVPQAQLGRDAVVEPVQDRQAIAAFRRCREPQQFDGTQVVEDPGV